VLYNIKMNLTDLLEFKLTSDILETIPALDQKPIHFMDLKAYFTTHSNKLAIFDFNDPSGARLYRAFASVNTTDPYHTYHQSILINNASYNSYCFDSSFQ
jgi:hypothetical protein